MKWYEKKETINGMIQQSKCRRVGTGMYHICLHALCLQWGFEIAHTWGI